jgi:hydrogenase 3 maturation protease
MEMKPTLPPSWLKKLTGIITDLTPPERPLRLAILGIGHELRGDDAAGLSVVRQLGEQFVPCSVLRIPYQDDGRQYATRNTQYDWLILDGGPAPENQTGALRHFRPDLVVMVDAAQMDMPPGTVAWLDMAQIDGVSAVTHLLPLNMLARYLDHELGCAVGMIGIQPAQTEMLAELSGVVETAVNQIVTHLADLAYDTAVQPT